MDARLGHDDRLMTFAEHILPAAPPRPRRPIESVDRDDAVAFIRLFYAENPEFGPAEPRIETVCRSIAEIGTYTHTSEELAFGARVAWRNSARCIGRLYWNGLVVRDRREIEDPAVVFDECVEHLRLAGNGGKIRPMITIFAARRSDGRGLRIHNDQLIRYAGYRDLDGSVTGDPAQVEFTRTAQRMGWSGAGTDFDVLPLIIDGPTGPPFMAELPGDAILEVPIEHPLYPWFAGLGLRWHAVPALANLDLHIGGITYPAAPFNGWYMGTEIASRNFGDVTRYNQLPRIAAQFGLDTSSDRTLWKDLTLVELNVAVLESFNRAGVTITDHHTESERFMLHLEREEKAGRTVPGDWSWLVPPISGSASPVFHRYYDPREQSPKFIPRGTGCPATPPPGPRP